MPELQCSSIPPAQVFGQSLTPSSPPKLPQYYSPAWQSQGWVSRWSPSPAHLLHGLWDVVHRVQFMPRPIPLPPLAAQPFQSSLFPLPGCIFFHYFMQTSQETKKISHLYLHTPGYSHITAKHNLLIIFNNYADKSHTEEEVQTYRFTLFMLP